MGGWDVKEVDGVGEEEERRKEERRGEEGWRVGGRGERREKWTEKLAKSCQNQKLMHFSFSHVIS